MILIYSVISPERQGKGTMGKTNTDDRVMVIIHCTSSHCALPLYEVVLNSNNQFSSYALDKKVTKGNNCNKSK
jgi:hypothetical protein